MPLPLAGFVSELLELTSHEAFVVVTNAQDGSDGPVGLFLVLAQVLRRVTLAGSDTWAARLTIT